MRKRVLINYSWGAPCTEVFAHFEESNAAALLIVFLDIGYKKILVRLEFVEMIINLPA